ncbi:MAG: hypothetical protein ABIU58_06025 [Ramlibacter sp.]
MLSLMLEKTTGLTRGNLLWIALSFLVVAQLAAFWILCSQQVKQAELRVATLQAQRVAGHGKAAPAFRAETQYYAAFR